MNVLIWTAENLSLTEMREFVQASQQIDFNGQSRLRIYARVQQTLVEQEYFRQRKKHRGVGRQPCWGALWVGQSCRQLPR